MLFIEAADRFKGVFFYNEASGGHGGELVGELKSPAVARAISRRVAVEVAGDASDAEGNARVLDSSIGVEEFGSNGANFGADSLTNEVLEPCRGDDFDVIVHEGDDFATALRDAKVLNGGVVKREVVWNDAYILGIIQLFQVGQTIWVTRLIVDEHDFPVRVGGEPLDAGDTFSEDL